MSISAMRAGYPVDYGAVMIAIFIFDLQKYFVEGMVGSLKQEKI